MPDFTSLPECHEGDGLTLEVTQLSFIASVVRGEKLQKNTTYEQASRNMGTPAFNQLRLILENRNTLAFI